MPRKLGHKTKFSETAMSQEKECVDRFYMYWPMYEVLDDLSAFLYSIDAKTNLA